MPIPMLLLAALAFTGEREAAADLLLRQAGVSFVAPPGFTAVRPADDAILEAVSARGPRVEARLSLLLFPQPLDPEAIGEALSRRDVRAAEALAPEAPADGAGGVALPLERVVGSGASRCLLLGRAFDDRVLVLLLCGEERAVDRLAQECRDAFFHASPDAAPFPPGRLRRHRLRGLGLSCEAPDAFEGGPSPDGRTLALRLAPRFAVEASLEVEPLVEDLDVPLLEAARRRSARAGGSAPRLVALGSSSAVAYDAEQDGALLGEVLLERDRRRIAVTLRAPARHAARFRGLAEQVADSIRPDDSSPTPGPRVRLPELGLELRPPAGFLPVEDETPGAAVFTEADRLPPRRRLTLRVLPLARRPKNDADLDGLARERAEGLQLFGFRPVGAPRRFLVNGMEAVRLALLRPADEKGPTMRAVLALLTGGRGRVFEVLFETPAAESDDAAEREALAVLRTVRPVAPSNSLELGEPLEIAGVARVRPPRGFLPPRRGARDRLEDPRSGAWLRAGTDEVRDDDPLRGVFDLYRGEFERSLAAAGAREVRIEGEVVGPNEVLLEATYVDASGHPFQALRRARIEGGRVRFVEVHGPDVWFRQRRSDLRALLAGAEFLEPR